jgi:hypothetical protein
VVNTVGAGRKDGANVPRWPPRSHRYLPKHVTQPARRTITDHEARIAGVHQLPLDEIGSRSE